VNTKHTKTTMDGGRNGGQNHSLAKRIARRDQDQLAAQIKTTNNASAGVQTLDPGGVN
jgi:hypothetical protein